jgi:hypothetical protein
MQLAFMLSRVGKQFLRECKLESCRCRFRSLVIFCFYLFYSHVVPFWGEDKPHE